ncbi:MAG: hypothetical protein V3V35_07430, partial [Dehalococcoidia bacterium]
AHLLMALIGLKSGVPADALHHIDHASLVAEPDVAARLGDVRDAVAAGRLHDAEHELEELAPETPGAPAPDEKTLHLQLALDSLTVDAGPEAAHHLQHYLQLPPDERFEAAQEALSLVQQGELHDAEQEIQEILGREHE